LNELKSKAIVAGSIFAALGLMLAGVGVQQAFAHASTSLTVEDGPAEGSVIRVVVGHSSEPSYGALPGIHDGKHNLEILLTDDATRMPLSGASLKADKFYFESLSKFKAAKGPNSADEVETGIVVGSVFGDPGHYVHRQVQKDGIYGYRIYGTVDFFGEGSADIDKTVFCTTEAGGTTKFNKGGWSGAFGCTEEIEDILFPEDNEALEEASLEGVTTQGTIQQAGLMASASQTSIASNTTTPGSAMPLFQILAVGATAVVGGIVGIKAFRRSAKDDLL
jgi:hypothetical protein